MLSVTRLRVMEPDLDAVCGQIDALAVQIPQAVKGMLVLIDAEVPIDLETLLKRLRTVGAQPIGVVDGPLNDEARRLGLPVLSKEAGRAAAPSSGRNEPESRTAPVREAEPAPAPAPTPASAAARRPTRVVTEPVRSGQQIYAEGGDLIILNMVSPGAEVIADGCIHVYGKLAGRALAGARGDESARIFCRKFEAELLAVAGIYTVAEQLKDAPRGQPAQIWLENGRLRIEPHTN
jgi:septum site-determining protein MinC